MMEKLLHYVWKHKLYSLHNLKTIDGIPIEIIDPGIYNSDAGPDFFNAKIKLKGELWAGNIEIHIKSSDWYNHKHDEDKAYDSVILHVVDTIDRLDIKDSSGRIIPQWLMNTPQAVKENYHNLLNTDIPISCLSRLKEIPPIYMNAWLSALLLERLERKSIQINNLLDGNNNDWSEVFYITLSRNFGFGINNEAFERLAKSLPLKYILKHSDSPIQIEALFLGQGGLLDSKDIENDYYSLLQSEYQFLAKKYKLQSLDAHIFKSLRIRPNNFPHVKIVQLSGLIRKQSHIFSCLLEEEKLKDFQSLFHAEIHEFWNTHYHFEKKSAFRPKKLGLSAVNILIINTVIPILFTYGQKKQNEKFIDKAIGLLESIKPESNYITNLFENQGVKIQHAGDSQALIQLKREYCEQKKCIYCRIGHRLLSKL